MTIMPNFIPILFETTNETLGFLKKVVKQEQRQQDKWRYGISSSSSKKSENKQES